MKKCNTLNLLIVTVSLFHSTGGSRAYAASEPFDQVYHTTTSSALDVWEIRCPNVKKRTTEYRNIFFRDGDVITIEAGGCVQTGGIGKTWKRYVDPRGPNSGKLYHGLIRLPNGSPALPKSPTVKELVRLSDVIAAQANGVKLQFKDSKKFDSLEPTWLVLGYEDDGYGDNGYWGHDDGTSDQCKREGAAWIRIKIEHRQQ